MQRLSAQQAVQQQPTEHAQANQRHQQAATTAGFFPATATPNSTLGSSTGSRTTAAQQVSVMAQTGRWGGGQYIKTTYTTMAAAHTMTL